MLKLVGSLCVASGGALAWYVQRAERRRERDTLSDLQQAFRRMEEEVRMARTPLPVLLKALARDCGRPAADFFKAVSKAAAVGEELPQIYTLANSAGEAERKRPEEEKRAAALWFSAAALLVILLI